MIPAKGQIFHCKEGGELNEQNIDRLSPNAK
jgi:hypothetical protein